MFLLPENLPPSPSGNLPPGIVAGNSTPPAPAGCHKPEELLPPIHPQCKRLSFEKVIQRISLLIINGERDKARVLQDALERVLRIRILEFKIEGGLP